MSWDRTDPWLVVKKVVHAGKFQTTMRGIFVLSCLGWISHLTVAISTMTGGLTLYILVDYSQKQRTFEQQGCVLSGQCRESHTGLVMQWFGRWENNHVRIIRTEFLFTITCICSLMSFQAQGQYYGNHQLSEVCHRCSTTGPGVGRQFGSEAVISGSVDWTKQDHPSLLDLVNMND